MVGVGKEKKFWELAFWEGEIWVCIGIYVMQGAVIARYPTTLHGMGVGGALAFLHFLLSIVA